MKVKLPEVLTEEEFIKVLSDTSKNHHRLAFALGFYECMRVSEVVNLRSGDVDKNLKLLHIRQGKGGKDRNIPISPKVMKGLKHLPVGVGVRALQIAFKKKVQDVLGKDFHFHTLRHSGITHYLVKEHWSSLEVQRLAGHSKISTTQIYTHINPEDLVERMWEK